MAYLLDTNVFIQAKSLHYGFDFCPAFWDWLVEKNREGDVLSIEKVFDELQGRGDELSQWASQRGERLFLKPDSALLPALATVSQWVSAQTYSPAAADRFLQLADYYLIAYALAHGHTVVTHEKPANSINHIKIPNVCIGLKVKCMTPFAMLRTERARFVLKS
jgi:predicted nucleic acid-binding protein